MVGGVEGTAGSVRRSRRGSEEQSVSCSRQGLSLMQNTSMRTTMAGSFTSMVSFPKGERPPSGNPSKSTEANSLYGRSRPGRVNVHRNSGTRREEDTAEKKKSANTEPNSGPWVGREGRQAEVNVSLSGSARAVQVGRSLQ